jgi:choline kinase
MQQNKNESITTAVLLAAGTGSRLQPLTNNAPKCLTEVSDVSILERLVNNLRQSGFKRLVVVVGYLERQIREFLTEHAAGLSIEYIVSRRYRTTNNIYSLWLIRKEIQEPFLLLECDLVFDTSLLQVMLYPDKIAISHLLPWMNGTMVTIDASGWIKDFRTSSGEASKKAAYKTVNIYSFSQASWKRIGDRLERHISEGRLNAYYETVFAELVAEGALSLQAAFFDPNHWYEVDTLEDLRQAERIFPKIGVKMVPQLTHPGTVGRTSMRSVRT